MNNKNIIGVKDFSSHLFWDMKIDNLDVQAHKKLIIRKVLLYGLIDDWRMICRLYNMSEISSVAKAIKELDERTMALISLLSKTPKEDFLCYTMKQSMPQHWHF